MQRSILMRNRRLLGRGAAVLLLAGVSAGCSSDLMRFNPGLTTSATATQPVYDQQIQTAAVSQELQAYPGDPTRQGDLDLTTTASINRQPATLRGSGVRHPVPSANVGSATAAPRQPFPQQSAPAAQPFPAAPAQATAQVTRQPITAPQNLQANVDHTVTGSVQQPAAAREGWTSAGGTQVTVRGGETVQNLSRRFGVPAKAILEANGLAENTTLKAGQQIVIPTYSSGGGSLQPVKTTAAAQLPSSDVPLPTRAPAERVAVLPQPARAAEREASQPKADAGRTATTGAVYTVVAGDTLSGIARKTGSSTSAIKQANGLDTGLIRIGQKLVIPGATVQTNVVASAPAGVDPVITGGTTRPAAGYTAPKPENAEIENMVQQAAVAPDATGVGRLRWPVHGRILSDFGSQNGGKRNDGIDIAVPEGTPVKAAENGVVIYAGDGLKDFGNTVLVRHENGLVTVYGHNGEITVSRGANVRRGQEIARSGLSGNAGTPKLHFEVRKDSAPVDPAKYLE